MDMGFTEAQVTSALEKAGWNEEAAVASLLGA
jgi:hypothetical protein